MISLGVVEFIERLPSLYFAACVLVVGRCVVLEITSFFQLGSRPLAVPVAYLHVALILGSVPLMSAIMGSL
jgi:hypothetical protein